MKKLIFIMLFVATGCTFTDSINMKNHKTGETAQCGPYNRQGINGPNAAAMQESQCIADFQRQGFERAAK